MRCDLLLLCNSGGVLAWFGPFKRPFSSLSLAFIHSSHSSCPALRPEYPSMRSSAGVDLPTHTPLSNIPHSMSYQRDTLCQHKSPGNRPCPSPHPHPHPPRRPRIYRRSPMAEEAEIASVISLIQGMYINNVSVSMNFISILQSSVQCAVCSVQRSPRPHRLRLLHPLHASRFTI